jgi:hypothetical protein
MLRGLDAAEPRDLLKLNQKRLCLLIPRPQRNYGHSTIPGVPASEKRGQRLRICHSDYSVIKWLSHRREGGADILEMGIGRIYSPSIYIISPKLMQNDNLIFPV